MRFASRGLASLVLAAVLLAAAAIDAAAAEEGLVFQECFNAHLGGCASNENPGLGNADAVAISPDGKSVYVASQSESGVVRLSRDTTTGALTYEECLTSEASGCGSNHGLTGMVDAQGVAVSPDGKSVYVTGFSSNGVAEFSRDTTTGALTYIGCKVAGTGACGAGNEEVRGLEGAWGVTISPDGKSVYVVGDLGGSIERFDRNGTTGSLTAVECLSARPIGCGSGNEKAPALGGATDVVVSPAGDDVYVAGGAPGTEGAVSIFSRTTGGALTYVGCKATGIAVCGTEVPGLAGAAGLAITADGKSVYVTGESDGAVTDFSRDTTTGALTDEGCLTGLTSGCATDSVPGLKGAFGIAAGPEGENVYVASLSPSEALVRLDRDTTTGALSYAECFTHQNTATVPCGAQAVHSNLPGMAGAERVAASPDGKYVYVAALSEGAISVFGPGEEPPASRHDLTVEKTGSGTGTVVSAPTGIECGPVCVHTFTDGTKVSLTATPASGSTFSGWSGAGCSGTGTCEVTISADQTVTATFLGSGSGESTPPPPSGQPPSSSGDSPSSAPGSTGGSTSTPHKKALTCRKGFKKEKVKGELRCVKEKHHKKPKHKR
ncbi:MAG TPA: beta-propeller fold lactonase family protein [Solirubrobacterales bacterium]|nr:beta-propeller fold lactonase family protein [Solirubrobacterales bacterium]